MTFKYGDQVLCERGKILKLARNADLQIVQSEAMLEGYQIYLVEQWVCNRNRPYKTVKVFTGDPSHRIRVCVVRITEENVRNASPELKDLLKEMEDDMASRTKPTEIGNIMVTDPSNFSSNLDMVLVPGGDYEEHIQSFYVNINLRRTQCAGRSALNLSRPSDAQQDKFKSLFKIADSMPFGKAVLELVRLAQASLHIFGLLPAEYIDGLLCNMTGMALETFYMEFGPFPGVELREVWLEPHLLASLLSKVVSCKTKLYSLGYPHVKDPFHEYEVFKSGIAAFQKYNKMSQTRSLDPPTLKMLNEFTSSTPLKVHRVIKSKLEDLSGNNPEDDETSDLDTFVRYVNIERLKVLWRPKGKAISQFDPDNPGDWLRSGKYLLTKVGGIPTKTGGVAVDIIKKAGNVAGSLTRMSTADPRPRQPERKSNSRNLGKVPSPQSTTPKERSKRPYVRMPVGSLQEMDEIVQGDGLASDIRKEQPLPNPLRIDTTMSTCAFDPHSIARSYSQSQSTPASPIDDDFEVQQPISPTWGELPRWSQPYPPRRQRSISVSHLPLSVEPVSTKRPDDASHARSILANPVAEPRAGGRAASRKLMVMDMQTYATYEGMLHKETKLKELIEKLQRISNTYDEQAQQLQATWMHRSEEYAESREVAEETFARQADMADQLKDMEVDAAKLQYELQVLEDKLREMEEFVDSFADKVRILEYKMPESQKSMQTMLIVGNYFRHYWEKWAQWWAGWTLWPFVHEKTS